MLNGHRFIYHSALLSVFLFYTVVQCALCAVVEFCVLHHDPQTSKAHPTIDLGTLLSNTATQNSFK